MAESKKKNKNKTFYLFSRLDQSYFFAGNQSKASLSLSNSLVYIEISHTSELNVVSRLSIFGIPVTNSPIRAEPRIGSEIISQPAQPAI